MRSSVRSNCSCVIWSTSVSRSQSGTQSPTERSPSSGGSPSRRGAQISCHLRASPAMTGRWSVVTALIACWRVLGYDRVHEAAGPDGLQRAVVHHGIGVAHLRVGIDTHGQGTSAPLRHSEERGGRTLTSSVTLEHNLTGEGNAERL